MRVGACPSLRRLHRKLVCVDGQIAFVGGINIIDDLDTPGHIPPRFDYAVRIEGPLVADVQYAMIQLWRRICWASFFCGAALRTAFSLLLRRAGLLGRGFV